MGLLSFMYGVLGYNLCATLFVGYLMFDYVLGFLATFAARYVIESKPGGAFDFNIRWIRVDYGWTELTLTIGPITFKNTKRFKLTPFLVKIDRIVCRVNPRSFLPCRGCRRRRRCRSRTSRSSACACTWSGAARARSTFLIQLSSGRWRRATARRTALPTSPDCASPKYTAYLWACILQFCECGRVGSDASTKRLEILCGSLAFSATSRYLHCT